jgi:hypothetical protein
VNGIVSTGTGTLLGTGGGGEAIVGITEGGWASRPNVAFGADKR